MPGWGVDIPGLMLAGGMGATFCGVTGAEPGARFCGELCGTLAGGTGGCIFCWERDGGGGGISA